MPKKNYKNSRASSELCANLTGRCGNFDMILGPFITHFLACANPTRRTHGAHTVRVWGALRSAHAHQMLIGACNPMLADSRPFLIFFGPGFRWSGSWTGGHVYSVLEDANHVVSFCSELIADCWSTATGAHQGDGTVHLTFHRCKPYPDVNKAFVPQLPTYFGPISRTHFLALCRPARTV